MLDLVVVITGASSGIGAALAQKVGAAGGRPVLVARREPELLAVAEHCGPEALAVMADVTRRDQVKHVLDAALTRWGHVDVWINNAGAAKHALNALTANLRMELRAEYPDIHVSTVSPGVVATDFGNNALGGGMDSRKSPIAQPVEDVADVIFDVIEHPRADTYTRAGAQALVTGYFGAEDIGVAETQPPFASVPST